MPMNGYLLFGFLLLVAALALFALVKLVRLYNSPDGERLRRMRMQGNFAPLSAEEAAEDKRRTQERAST